MFKKKRKLYESNNYCPGDNSLFFPWTLWIGKWLTESIKISHSSYLIDIDHKTDRISSFSIRYRVPIKPSRFIQHLLKHSKDQSIPNFVIKPLSTKLIDLFFSSIPYPSVIFGQSQSSFIIFITPYTFKYYLYVQFDLNSDMMITSFHLNLRSLESPSLVNWFL